MKQTTGKTENRRFMRRLILCAMFFCVILFVIAGVIGYSFQSNSYYTEFARNQNELLESYYHYIDKCMDDATRTSLRIIADDSVQHNLHEIMVSDGVKLAEARTNLHNAVHYSRGDRVYGLPAISGGRRRDDGTEGIKNGGTDHPPLRFTTQIKRSR